MGESVGSTSWPNRHRAYFARLAELLRDRPHPRIIIVGPGAVTSFCRPFLHDAGRPAAWWRLRMGDAARYADQLLRRIPMMPLESLEPLEVRAALGRPHDMLVTDVSTRVLKAVRRCAPMIDTMQLDLAAAPLPFAADAVIAFNVVCRIGDGHAAMRNLLPGIACGGFLLMDDRSASRCLPSGMFEPAADKTHRRITPQAP